MPRFLRPRYWLHLLLFLLTLLTTTAVGVDLQTSFQHREPPFLHGEFFAFTGVPFGWAAWSQGLPFSLTLLGILLCHECGHYFACQYYGLQASLPYFLPAPTLIGTLGAFIRIRSHIYSRLVLFDVGAGGPLAGFVVLVPLLLIGLTLSQVVPGYGARSEVIFGTPLLLSALESLRFPGQPARDIMLHPIARGAWVGLFATALNLLPIGQLDGGHILYALLGERQKILSRIFLLALVPLGFLYHAWWFWAAVLFLLGRRHPFIYDPTPVPRSRWVLGAIVFVIFVLSFMPVPLHFAGE